MNKEQQPSQDKKEEVDLIIFFNYIGEKLEKLFGHILAFFKAIFSGTIYLLKTFFKNWKIVLGVIVIAYGIGYYMERNKQPRYTTSMLVEPYFDSKYQLITNIKYFNALIASQDTGAIQKIFNITEKEVKDLKGFKIEPGPETENERLIQYEEFKSRLDSLSSQDLPYDEFLANRSVYSGKYYLITATSTKKDIFKKLENGIYSSFENSYSKKIMGRDSLIIDIQRRTLLQQLQRIDSLKNIYIDVLKLESQKYNPVSFGEAVFKADKQQTKEFDLLNKELALRDQLKDLEERLIKKDDFFDVITGFQKVGNMSYHWSQRYKLILPVLALLILCGLFIIKKIIEYIFNYEK
ncbi:hypothetical protein [Aurantibacter sp.]|uniref:hypothetical protein n=1 Tax=Aurantibacter sp. TaxID=2807103 RepID=UPI0035C7D9D0